MADLTKELEITSVWTEITVALSLADGSTYLVDVNGANQRATVYVADTDAATPPPTVAGHPWTPIDKNRTVHSRTYEKLSGTFTWVRIDRGSATLEVTKVE